LLKNFIEGVALAQRANARRDVNIAGSFPALLSSCHAIRTKVKRPEKGAFKKLNLAGPIARWVEPFAKPISLQIAIDGYRFRSIHPTRYFR
jgi:hypothetical protein